MTEVCLGYRNVSTIFTNLRTKNKQKQWKAYPAKQSTRLFSLQNNFLFSKEVEIWAILAKFHAIFCEDHRCLDHKTQSLPHHRHQLEGIFYPSMISHG